MTVKQAAESVGVTLTDAAACNLTRYKQLLLEWNEKMNLTAITDESGVLIKHFADSFTLLPIIQELGGARLIDVGSGAGFPGLPLAIADERLKATLLDSLNKRVNFLNAVIADLSLKNVTARAARAEDGSRDENLRGKFDFCACRAVAAMPVLSELCMPYIKVGGYFLAMKGADCGEELSAASPALKILGGEIKEIKTITLASEPPVTHSVIIIKKIRQTPLKFPRKFSQISKTPLK